MALCIFNSLKRLSTPLNCVRFQSKYLSNASFSVANESIQTPAIHANHNDDHHVNREMLWRNTMSYVKRAKLLENAFVYSEGIRSGGQAGGTSDPNRCSDEQLSLVFENLREYLPQLFVTVMDYKIYHPQLVFENRIQGKTTVGVTAYIVKISLLRMYGHFKYAYVNMDILKMTKHTDDSSIKIRWRISGITGFQMITKMWKFKVWKPTEMLEHRKVWIDGFSTMYVGGDGKIFKHVVDKVIPDQNFEEREKSKIISPLGAVPKMALIVGLSPEISSVILS